MINFKKMDDKDFVFINKNLSEKEDKEFSAFLKRRKQRTKQVKADKKPRGVSKMANALVSE